jgi:hypothetical protein
MAQLYLLAVVTGTSLLAYLVARRAGAASSVQVRAALGTMLEYLGLLAAFLVLNVAVTAGAILLVRGTTGRFVSIYVANDLFLVLASLLQALVFGALLTSRRRAGR